MKICAISDLHGNLPEISECDLLLIAGDICPDFGARPSSVDKQVRWFQGEFLGWLNKQPIKDVLGTWGNHDWIPSPQRQWANLPEEMRIIKVDQLIEYSYDGGMVKIWFSPWSNQFGNWAWMREPEDLEGYYQTIPEGTDLIVSHQPPRGFCDKAGPPINTPDLGSKELLCRTVELSPRAVICGHIHGGHGWHHMNDHTTVYNVSLVDEYYKPVNPVTIINWS